jgi:peptidyl-prolyl cis-trans isomerase B (cyclophilin B)
MKRIIMIIWGLFLLLQLLHAETIIEIQTSVGTIKIKLYDDVPNHVRTFTTRAKQGLYDGTLFTRVIPGFMIQGGSSDSRNAPPGARVGSGDRNTEIMPEFNPDYYHKRGVISAPRQDVSVNPQKKSDMSQFFIVQGTIYSQGGLDTLELIANQAARKRAFDEFYYPVKSELDSLRPIDTQIYNSRIIALNAKIDSVVRATPGYLIFTPEQREAYTTIGGAPHLDREYTIYGEVIEGFEVIDTIAAQPRDAYDRPRNDVRIISVKAIQSASE